MSLSKNKSKYIRSLHKKKFRQKYNKFIVEGDKIVQEILQSPTVKIELLLALDPWLEAHHDLWQHLPEDNVEAVSQSELRQISTLQTPNQTLLVAEQLHPTIDEELVRSDWSLYLDGIQDPGNLGTILRTADWFGIRHVFCSQDCVDVYNTKVLQATMGAFLRVRVIELAFPDWKSRFPNVPAYGTVLHATSLFNARISKSGILVLGNEGNGISADILAQLDEQVTIPPHPTGGAESLNVGVATGILCAAVRHFGK